MLVLTAIGWSPIGVAVWLMGRCECRWAVLGDCCPLMLENLRLATCGSMASLLDDDSELLSCGIAGRQSTRPSTCGEPKPKRPFSPSWRPLPLVLMPLLSGLLINLSPLSRRPGLGGDSSFIRFPSVACQTMFG